VNPNPGTRVFQRLNRAEYARAVRDLLGLEVDAGNWLPLDSYLGNFDNMADAQALSPTLLDAYLTAAGTISRMAVGNPEAPATHSTYTQPALVSQHNWDHVEGAPFGTRGGIVALHDFPADGEYVFEMETRSGTMATFEDIDVSINGERIALLPFEPGLASGEPGRGLLPPYGAHPAPGGAAPGLGGLRPEVRGSLRGPPAPPRVVPGGRG
jgi:hypothetical protein